MKRFAAVFAAMALLVSSGFLLGCGRSSLDQVPLGGSLFDGSTEGGPEGGSEGGPGCTSNAECASTPSTPYCLIPPGKCVACETSPQCPVGDVCHDHECVPICSGGTCAGGLSCCFSVGLPTGFCVDEKTDPNDCGGCGVACPPGEACVESSCRKPASCNGGPVCAPGEACCASGCADTNSNPENCGTCGRACAPGDTCVAGNCHSPVSCNGGPACTPPKQCCASGCDDTSSDPNNCGGCGNKCAPGQSCVESACTIGASCHGEPACTGGQTCCTSGCSDTQTDPKNCGGCGTACPPGDTCVASACQSMTMCNGGPACKPGLACCKDGCDDTTSNPSDCGGCGIACSPTEKCVASMCQSTTSCNGGPACKGSLACCKDGCDDTTTDPANCGGCGIACAATEKCIASKCQSITGCGMGPPCPSSDMCCSDTCTNTNTDPNNCGGCGMPCAMGDICKGGKCKSTMGCNGGPVCKGSLTCCTTGCTDTTGDPLNCGGCGMPCPPDNTCSGSVCIPPDNCNGGPACSPPEQCCATGCINTTKDASNCGACGNVCPPGDTCVKSTCTPPAGCGSGPACTGGDSCCSGTCVNTNSDPANCGGCGTPCAYPGVCTGGTCSLPTTCLNPFVNPTYLAPGVHSYTCIDIPAGVTVYVAGGGTGSGTLQLFSSGDIIIDGTIDLTGGPGTQDSIASFSTQSGYAGAGGYTGEPYQSGGLSNGGVPCGYVSGVPGLLGFPAEGTAGGCTIYTGCDFMYAGPLVFAAELSNYGGGAGVFTGYRAYGGGGGGPAGGAPGALGAAYPGEMDCAGASGSGGAVSGFGGLGGGAPYDGATGVSGQTECPGSFPGVPPAYVGGGGGGSIGPYASADLAVASTFQPGSGGGGGSADYLNRPQFGGTSGGGAGGGALMLSSGTKISVTGQVFANGGKGGDAYIGTGSITGCNPQPGAGGGGGSGGIIFMTAPDIDVSSTATISAAGGGGGLQSLYATGGGGGAGGLGRIRLSVAPSTCTLSGTFNPPLSSGCSAASASGHTYVAAWPN